MPLDGRNWKPETETKPNVFSLEGLIAWLETMPQDDKYEFGNCEGACLIGLYAAAMGYPDWLEIHAFPLPKPSWWANHLPFHFGTLAALMPHTYGAALSRARALLASRSKG